MEGYCEQRMVRCACGEDMSTNVLPPNTNAEMAALFFETWFGSDYDDQFVTVSQMAPGSKRMRSRSPIWSAAR